MVAIAGSALATIEMAFHLAAFTEHDHLVSGAATPTLLIHEVLAVIAYPIFGIALAVLAIQLAPGWPPLLRVVSVLGALGALCQAAAGPLVVLTHNQAFVPLFRGALLISLWLIVLGGVGLRVESAAAPAQQVQT